MGFDDMLARVESMGPQLDTNYLDVLSRRSDSPELQVDGGSGGGLEAGEEDARPQADEVLEADVTEDGERDREEGARLQPERDDDRDDDGPGAGVHHGDQIGGLPTSRAHGGSGGSGGRGDQAAVAQPRPPAEDTALETSVQQVTPAARSGDVGRGGDRMEVPVSMRHSWQHSDEIGRSSRGGSSSGGTGQGRLPATTFEVSGVSSTPFVRSMPDELLQALRERLVEAAMTVTGVSRDAAEGWVRRRSQASLVVAVLMAVLDVRLETDAGTATAAGLLARSEPMAAGVLGALDRLEERAEKWDKRLAGLQHASSDMREGVEVLGNMVAFVVADQVMNLLRGNRDVRNIDYGHEDVVQVLSDATEATEQMARVRREREGRPRKGAAYGRGGA